MKPGFLKDLASCGILVALALFDMAFGEAPICAALVFDKQKSSFARYFPVNYRAAAALIKTIYRIGAFLYINASASRTSFTINLLLFGDTTIITPFVLGILTVAITLPSKFLTG